MADQGGNNVAMQHPHGLCSLTLTQVKNKDTHTLLCTLARFKRPKWARNTNGLLYQFSLKIKDARSISPKVTDWRIPRPILYTGSSRTDSCTYTSNYERNIRTIYGFETTKQEKLDHVHIDIPNEAKWLSSGSSSSSSSRTASSGSLLISPSNLNSLKHEPITVKPADTQSLASSTHFTLINGVTLPRKHISSCCSKSRQLSVLVITMTIILFCGILGAVLFVELRAMELRHP